MKARSALVIFGTKLPTKGQEWWSAFASVVAPLSLRAQIEEKGCTWIDLESFVKPGSIYKASAMLEEFATLKLPNGTPLTKSYMYKGYELWWIHHTDLFLHFCLPYFQYQALLEYLKDFQKVHFFEPLYTDLMKAYLTAHDRQAVFLNERRSVLPMGVVLQALLTVFFIPFLALRRKKILVFTSDKFYDYDFRLKLVYEELRTRKLPFVEFVRSMQPWRDMLLHAKKRKRPVVYSVGVVFIAGCMSRLTGGRYLSQKRYDTKIFASIENPLERFKFIAASEYLSRAGDDIWAIRIMHLIVKGIGVKTAFIVAATERSLHTVLACKLACIPTVGILHGFASRHYNGYDFMPGYTGEKTMSVDTYGVWSEWWKEYYLTHSKAYRPEQLYVSGVMRPFTPEISSKVTKRSDGETRVLFVSEIVAVPTEVVPYLDTLLAAPDLSVYIKFRATNDSFESWLKYHRPDILEKIGEGRILKGSMQEAIVETDIAVGSQSTGVIEATLQHKPFVFFNTEKWGDYYDMRKMNVDHTFFAENPEEFVTAVRNARHIPPGIIENLQKKFFGDPGKNGSKWVVNELTRLLSLN